MLHVLSMLTENDVTVPDAGAIFEENRHSKVLYWGFKDAGTNHTSGAALARQMRNAGKRTVYEALTTDEAVCLEDARFAVDCKFSLFLGMKYFRSVSELLKQNDVDYYPSVGKREGENRLRGAPEELIKEARAAREDGCHGIRLSVFRYLDGDPQRMGEQVLSGIGMPFLITGSVNTYEKLDFVRRMKPWGFTIGGSLLFSNAFAPGSVAEKLDLVQDYVRK